MNRIDLDEVMRKHELWLSGLVDGERANLSETDLSGVNFSGVNFSGANFSGANFSGANFSGANLSGVDLSGANLFRVNLFGANFSEANLSGARYFSCRGNNTTIKTIHCDTYDIAYTSEVIQIGCEQHSIKKWFEFEDSEIEKMDSGALNWWKIWKPIIKKIIKYSPAESTGF